jgi:hypothetical protein
LIFDNKYLYRWMEEAERFAKENNLGLHEWEFSVGFYMPC